MSTYTILTGREMIQSVSGVLQILEGDNIPISASASTGVSRPSKTFFSAIISANDDTLKFLILVPQPLDVSAGVLTATPSWMPILTVTPMEEYSQIPAYMFNDGFPDPVTRVLTIDLETARAESESYNFLIGIDFKHSIV